MKKLTILGFILVLFAFAALTHARCISEDGEMRMACIEGEGMGQEGCRTVEMDCCQKTDQHGLCHHGAGECEGNFFLCCAKTLELDESQMGRLKALRLEHRKSMIRMNADLEILELEFKHAFHESEPNRSTIEGKIAAMGYLKTKMKKSQVNAVLDARSVLSKKQLEKYRHGSCDCLGTGLKKAMEDGSCSKERACTGACSVESKKCQGHGD